MLIPQTILFFSNSVLDVVSFALWHDTVATEACQLWKEMTSGNKSFRLANTKKIVSYSIWQFIPGSLTPLGFYLQYFFKEIRFNKQKRQSKCSIILGTTSEIMQVKLLGIIIFQTITSHFSIVLYQCIFQNCHKISLLETVGAVIVLLLVITNMIFQIIEVKTSLKRYHHLAI